MKFKIFGKTIELTGADFFKTIAFVLFTITSMYFSMNMWYELGQDFREKTAFVMLSVAIDSLKTYAVILAGGLVTSFKYYFRLRKQSKLHSIIAGEKFRKAFVHAGLYIIAASTSIMAITGFGLVTVDRYNKSHSTVAIVSTVDKTASYRQEIAGYEEDIIANNESIKIEELNIATQRDLMKNLDKEVKGYAWYIGEYQKKIDKAASKIDTYRNENSALRDKIKSVNAQIREIENQAEVAVVEDKEIRSSMFELIAKALGGINPTTVMLFMMVLAAFVNELGIVATSPQFKTVDENEDVEKLLKVIDPKKLRNKINKERQKNNEALIPETAVATKEAIKEEVEKFISVAEEEKQEAKTVAEHSFNPVINITEENKEENYGKKTLLRPLNKNPIIQELLEKKGLIHPKPIDIKVQKPQDEPVKTNFSKPLDTIEKMGYSKGRNGFDRKKLNDLIDEV